MSSLLGGRLSHRASDVKRLHWLAMLRVTLRFPLNRWLWPRPPAVASIRALVIRQRLIGDFPFGIAGSHSPTLDATEQHRLRLSYAS